MRLPVCLSWLLVVAAGITQPGGVGTTIFAEDSSHADAGGDGFFDEIDFLAKFPADFVDDGSAGKRHFRCKVSLQNGDGTGSAETKIRFRDCEVALDSAKFYQVSLVGVANRHTQLGEEFGTDGSWKGAGLSITGLSTLTIRGHLNLFASRIYNATGNVAIRPPSANSGKIRESTLECPIGIVSFLGETTIPFGPVRNLAIIHRPTTLNSVFNIPDVDGLDIYPATGSQYAMRASGNLSVKNMRIHQGLQTLGDILPISSSVDWHIGNPTWSQIVASIPAIQIPGFNVWEDYDAGVKVFDPRDFLPESGISVEILNVLGATVVDAATDSEGQITFGSGGLTNLLSYRKRSGAGATIEDQFPWTVRVNHKGAVNPAFLGMQFVAMPQGNSFTGGRQFSPLRLSIALVPRVASGQEEWRPALA